MAIFEDILKEGFKRGNITSGLAVGLGVVVLAPAIAPLLRPAAKAVIKSGLIAYDGGRAAFSAVSHGAQDVVSEARSEMESQSGAGEAGKKDSGDKAGKAPAVKKRSRK
jgi:hypothetical protein